MSNQWGVQVRFLKDRGRKLLAAFYAKVNQRLCTPDKIAPTTD